MKRNPQVRQCVKPICVSCGEIWLPPEGVDAQVSSCPSCSDHRRAVARAHFDSTGVSLNEGVYWIRRKRGSTT
jgi:hypothetical protein